MKKSFLILFCMFFTGNASLFADDFDKEQVILKGLSKESRKERQKFLEMAKYTDSPAIFEKLARMYKVEPTEEDIIFAMRAMNTNNNGKFSSELAEAVKEEYFRLKPFGWNPPDFCYPAYYYLIIKLSNFQERPYPGYDDFVDYVMQNVDDVLPSDIHPDAKKEFLNECTLYFATRDRPGYMQKLTELYIKDEISAGLRVYRLFTAKKDPAIFEEFTRRLSRQSKEDYSDSVFEAYKEYAAAIKKIVSKALQKKLEEEKRIYREESRAIFEEFLNKPQDHEY